MCIVIVYKVHFNNAHNAVSDSGSLSDTCTATSFLSHALHSLFLANIFEIIC